ncbi:WD40 repeat protein, partial [Cryomyces antarcticus]
MALDESGATLREAIEMIELKSPSSERGSFLFEHSRLELPRTKRNGVFLSARSSESGSQEFESPSAGRGR